MDVSQEILKEKKKSTFMYLGLTIQKYYSDQEIHVDETWSCVIREWMSLSISEMFPKSEHLKKYCVFSLASRYSISNRFILHSFNEYKV